MKDSKFIPQAVLNVITYQQKPSLPFQYPQEWLFPLSSYYVHVFWLMVLLLAYKVLKWVRSDTCIVEVPNHRPYDVTCLDGDVDSFTIEEMESTKYRRVAGKLAAIARMELPLYKHTLENELVAREFLKKYMEAKFFRKSDMVKILPLALKFCFVQTKYERDARLDTLSWQYQDMYKQTHSRYSKAPSWYDWIVGKDVREHQAQGL